MAPPSVILQLAAATVLLAPFAAAFSPSSFRLPHSRPPRPLSAGPKDEPASAGAGPRGESRRSSSRRRPPGRSRSRSSSSSGPATAIKRAPHQFDHTKEKARPFVDALTEIKSQPSNEDAEPYDLPADAAPGINGDVITHRHIETRSLDDLFPNLGLSRLFATTKEFRTALRGAMREDVFDTTPAYAGMSDKARRMLLLPDSSLQGSWRCHDGKWVRQAVGQEGEDEITSGAGTIRMVKLTQVLKEYLGEGAPTGDAFMDTIGSLCGSKPSTHWIDIVGVLDRRIPHSWHQDTGRSPDGDTYTVLFGSPPLDNYDGVGVFSHLIKLKREHFAADVHPSNEPVLFGGMDDMDNEFVVRPRFAEGREFIIYRDVDVLHSSPDIAYRASVMRFM